MKKLSARVLSFLTVLAILVSVLTCMSAVSAAPKYNNGKFGVVCKALSAQAQAYYTGNYTFEKLNCSCFLNKLEQSENQQCNCKNIDNIS